MARTLTDAKLGTRASRRRLPQRREPHWRSMSEGIAVGYRKGTKGGTWIAKHYTSAHGRRFRALGTADDVVDADGQHILSFSQAQERAREWFRTLAHQDAGNAPSGPYTVAQALSDYLEDYKARSGKALQRMRYNIDAHIIPAVGEIEVSKLTRSQIRKWRNNLASTPARLRTRVGQDQKFRKDTGPDVHRQRKSTANKILTILKAALNHAHTEGKHVGNPDAWREVKPFKNVDTARVRYLDDQECTRLVNACPPDLRQLVTAALLTGCRYGELAALRVRDIDIDAGTIHISESKSGKPRNVFLTEEGQEFFDEATLGKAGGDLVFRRASGAAWKRADQFRPLKQACAAAKITPAVGFHILRHSYGSRLAMNAAPMAVIAQQLGHSDTRMTEKHYAHLSPSFVADTIRAAAPKLGIVKRSNVSRLTDSQKNKLSPVG